ncbi:hypothetical protein LUZ60_004739 [Juncus effusus]|nr:hypothetical protein LUZ60_004739 [Juncus effusus]
MSQPPPADGHPEADDWDFLTDHFISSSSLSPPPPNNPFLSPISPVSSNPFLSPEPSISTNPFLSGSSGTNLSASFSDSSQSVPYRSASLPFSPTPPTGHNSAPGPHRSASLSSNSGYYTPPSSPPLAFSNPSDNTPQLAPPTGLQHTGSLPEFSGRATQDQIFRPLARSTVDETRPVPLTLRPRPPRESQLGFALRSIVFFPPSHLWAGHESGLRVWNTNKLFDGIPDNKSVRRGDEESSPFVESRRTSAVLSMAVDLPRGVVWSGHADGRITGWRADGSGLVNGFEECVLWEAHQRAPVLSMAITPYGELWSGSEGGSIKVWSSEAIKESLCLKKEEKSKAYVLFERSCIDLRSLVSENGTCPVPTVDVKILMCDNDGSKVWSGGYLSFILWDCRTKELIKIMSSIDGSPDSSFPSDPSSFPSDPSKTQKSRNSPNFFQRSKNALLGAAETVRRVAVKAAFGDDVRKLESIASSADGTIWVGGSNGSVSHWDPNGFKLKEFTRNSASVLSIFTFGTRVWVGYSDGKIQIMDLEGKLLSSWTAHKSPVLKITMGGNYIYTLANHGGIRAWSLSSPGPTDSIIRAELAERESKYTRTKHVKMVFGTWNVGQEKAGLESIKKWIGVEVREEAGIVVVGLQEVDMGAGFLAMSAAKETVGMEGTPSPNGEWWLDAIGRCLGGAEFYRVSSRQMAGLLIAVWARKSLKQYISDLESAVVACGLGRAIGNKGAVGLRMRICGRIMSFVNCHLAAHLEAVNRRNEDFDHIYRTLTFAPPAGASGGPLFRGANVTNNRKPDLSQSDLLIFLGDFNYRLDSVSYEEAMDLIYKNKFDKLRARDQLNAEMKLGRVFQGLREAQIKFAPTYKFDKYVSGVSGYDSSEKKRIPAWCDRILYRDSRTVSEPRHCSLDCPIVSSVSLYDACMEAVDSDHKPVKCVLNVDISYVGESIRRQEYAQIISSNKKIKSLFDQYKIPPEISLSANELTLKNQEISVLRVSNNSRNEKGIFEIFCCDFMNEGENTRVVFPKWLKVNPASGIINPGQTIDINIQHGDLYGKDFYEVYSTNKRNEENQEKNAILIFKITNNYSTEANFYKVNTSHISSKGFASRNVMYSGGSQMW